jgi:hypothetical protein
VVRRRLRLFASAAMLLAASVGSGGPATASSERSFALRGYVFDIEEVFNRQAPFVLKWRVTVCTSSPAKIRVRAITVEPRKGEGAWSPFVRRQSEGCTRHRFRSFNAPFHQEGDDLRSRLRVAWRGQRLRTPWRTDSTAFAE